MKNRTFSHPLNVFFILKYPTSWPRFLFSVLRSPPETISTSGLRGQPASSPHHCVSPISNQLSPVLQPLIPALFFTSKTLSSFSLILFVLSRSEMAFPAVSLSRRNSPWTGLRSFPARTMWPWPGWTAGAGSDVGRRPPPWTPASLARWESKIILELLSQYSYATPNWGYKIDVWGKKSRINSQGLWYSHRLLMQLSYIDDRRMALYGKVTALLMFVNLILPLEPWRFCCFLFQHFSASLYRHSEGI